MIPLVRQPRRPIAAGIGEEVLRAPEIADPIGYRPLGPPAYIRVFEFSKTKPPYRWEKEVPSDSIQRIGWTAEKRAFTVHSNSGGRFILIEQFFSGWQATVDDKPVPIERWNRAFQSVLIPSGDHRLSFTFRSRGFRLGAIISVVALLTLLLTRLRGANS